MAFVHGNISVFKFDATEGGVLTDISQYVEKVTPDYKRDVKDIKRIGGNAVKRITGPVVSSYKLSGAFDATLHTMFTTARDAAAPVTRSIEYGPAGSATGAPKETAEVFVADYGLDDSGDNAVMWSAELVVDGAITSTTY